MPFVFFPVCVFWILSIYFWLCRVFIALHRLSLAVASWGYFLAVVHRLLIAVASLLQSMGCRARRLQQLQFTGSRACTQSLWCMGLVAPQHLDSSQTRGGTRAPCISRHFPIHRTTREVQSVILISAFVFVWYFPYVLLSSYGILLVRI